MGSPLQEETDKGQQRLLTPVRAVVVRTGWGDCNGILVRRPRGECHLTAFVLAPSRNATEATRAYLGLVLDRERFLFDRFCLVNVSSCGSVRSFGNACL